MIEHALTLHERHHEIDPHSGHRVSFGLVRMANIGPLFDVAQALYALDAPHDVRIHLCVYHSQFPLLSRSAIETRLDAALDRRTPSAVYELADIRAHLDAASEPDQLFIVLGSPVTEVGRDHDYDWAVVEPSSMRSIIQLAGPCTPSPNRRCRTIQPHPAESNWQGIAGRPDEPVFNRPGFENGDHRLATHALNELLAEDEYSVIDSRPRLVAREPSNAATSLVDLEHARMANALLAPDMPPRHLRPPWATTSQHAAPAATGRP